MRSISDEVYAGAVRVQPDSAEERKKGIASVVMLCAGCLLLNMLGLQLAKALGLTLYLDCIGTILAAAAGGFLPGVAVGFLTNALASISSPFTAFYGSLSVLIGLCASYAAQKGWLKKLSGILLTIVLLALIGGALGSVLTWLLNGLQIGDDMTTELSKRICARCGMPPFWGLMSANVLVDLADKAIAVAAAAALLRLLPRRWLELFQSFGWQQNPLSTEAKTAAQQRYSRTMSLRSKILLLITAATVLIAASAANISFMLFSEATQDQLAQLSSGVASVAASMIDASRVDEYVERGEAAEGYAETENRLRGILESSPDVLYLYVYQIREDGCHVVFDLDTEAAEGGEPGEIIPFEEAFYPVLPALLAGEEIEPIVSNGSFGWLLTVYKPVRDANGVCRCYAAADISMTQVIANEYAFIAKVISLFFGFLVLVLALGLWLAEYNITFPINTMALAAGAFAYNSETARSDSLSRIRELGIRTGDEIEHLYSALEKTTEDTVRYITDAQEKSEEINKLQEGLILVLADIVESRDRYTGHHIRKTADYTRIIMEQMRRDGIHADVLTDQYINDVIRSAPLHDIGKIQVPDAILNKPSRLTDEEFTQMKNHTNAGSSIISRAITAVSGDSGYLEEARNLAAYHHERWDGTGYPNGIAGEDIPLSARIMAVADVFDALVSRRSYKEPFPVENAMSVIREGSGTHFDPTVVDAFLRAEDEVRRAVEANCEDGTE
ncbi:MAG: HD domain-containing protein [Oscillospiraceae bacterium]|nr:HD domain-containing protein [Oscillospiraceae bacterium]